MSCSSNEVNHGTCWGFILVLSKWSIAMVLSTRNLYCTILYSRHVLVVLCYTKVHEVNKAM